MAEERLRSEVAGLESQVDVLESLITDLDGLLRECGFPNGISTLKETVEELLKENQGKNPFTEIPE